MTTVPHISVCVCTYKRPELLKQLLDALRKQDTNGAFTYSVVISDNDYAGSARQVAEAAAQDDNLKVRYSVEPRQNIALARNNAVANAEGDFIAWIDDDEFPGERWLMTMLESLRRYNADGVLGPVVPHFSADAPKWVVKGGFYDRVRPSTGTLLHWQQCRTGNALIKMAVFAEDAQPFRPECLSGEDQDFFKRQLDAKRTFVWCDEAPAYEWVPPVRWKRSFLLKRALFRGVYSFRNRNASLFSLLKSLVATTAYIISLPFVLFLGQARFMRYVFNCTYHFGRLIAVFGIQPIDKPYVTE